MLDAYIAHNKKIADLWIEHKRAIVSCSLDAKIYIRALSANEFDNQVIENRDEPVAVAEKFTSAALHDLAEADEEVS